MEAVTFPLGCAVSQVKVLLISRPDRYVPSASYSLCTRAGQPATVCRIMFLFFMFLQLKGPEIPMPRIVVLLTGARAESGVVDAESVLIPTDVNDTNTVVSLYCTCLFALFPRP
jgi:hypothetical protein